MSFFIRYFYYDWLDVHISNEIFPILGQGDDSMDNFWSEAVRYYVYISVFLYTLETTFKVKRG